MSSPIPCLCSRPPLIDSLTGLVIEESLFPFSTPSYITTAKLQNEIDSLKMGEAELQKELKLAQDKIANLTLFNKSADDIIFKLTVMNDQANQKMRTDQQIINLYKNLVKNHEEEAGKADEKVRKITEERDELLEQLSRKEENEKKLQKEMKEMAQKMEQYRNTAIDYKMKLKEQTKWKPSPVKQTPKKVASPLENQLNGNWKYICSQKSEGFELPRKFRTWLCGTLHLNLDGDRFTSHVKVQGKDVEKSEMILGKDHKSSAGKLSFRSNTIIKNNHFITWETSFCSETLVYTECWIDRSIENGLLNIKIYDRDTLGKYTFKKC